jgi:hypothetical protein
MPHYLPHGTTVSCNSVDIGGITSISIPDRTRGEAETTDTDSGGDREYIVGLREAGTVDISFRHDPDDSGQQELDTQYDAAAGSAIIEFVITLPDAATSASGSQTYTFDGFVQTAPSGDLNTADDEAAELSATIRVSGAVTIA